MKKCRGCNEEKEIESFYKNKKMPDGYFNKCKACTISAAIENRNKNIERYREYDRKRGNRQPHGYSREYRRLYPKKYKAHNMVNNAIRDGRLKKEESCTRCDFVGAVHAHHDDYAFPLSVRWLCAACHKQWHTINGEGKNAT